MANITTIGEGRNKKYKLTYECKRIDGNRHRKSITFPVGTPRSQVEDIKRKVEIEYKTGKYEIPDITFNEFVKEVYLKEYAIGLSVTTLHNYKSLLFNDKEYSLINYFGEYYLKNISRFDVQKYTNILAQNVSPKTVRSYVMFLHKLFEWAKIAGFIEFPTGDSPIDNLLLPPKKQGNCTQAYTLDEIKILLKLADENLISLTIIGLGALAGLRRGEMAGLKWQNVFLDIDQPYIKIDENRVSVSKDVYVKGPKSKAGYRDIPIPQGLADILKRRKIEYLEQKLCNTNFKDEDYVISKPDGTPYAPDGISTNYIRLIQKTDDSFPKLTLHMLRHTYASLLINQGANIKVVQANMGHSDVFQTLSIYSHAYDSAKEIEAKKLNEIVFDVKLTG